MHIDKTYGKGKLFNKINVRAERLDPGVYIFTDPEDQVIYVGKAKRIKYRLRSYLSKDQDRKTELMLKAAQNYYTIYVRSELEALLLEAKCVKKYTPKFNIELRDDKHPLYIKVSNDFYPILSTARKVDLKNYKNYWGPFPNSSYVRTILALLRKVFPFANHPVQKRKCLYSHIGLCNPCPSFIEKQPEPAKSELRKKYLRNIRLIKFVLNGYIEKIYKELDNKMRTASAKLEFERAERYKQQLEALEYITQPIIPPARYIEDPKLIRREKKLESEDLEKLLKESGIVIKKLGRIECFDISHLGGSFPTASMVTFQNGRPDKKMYRHFRIRQKKGNSDTDSLNEAIKRRIEHVKDWGVPDLIIVDGGASQVSSFLKHTSDLNIPVVGIAKRYETLVIPKKSKGYIYKKIGRRNALYLIQKLRDEAHRFARRYHHFLLKKNLLK